MDDKKKRWILVILMITLMAGWVNAQCIQRVILTNMLTEDDLTDQVLIYQNDSLSKRWIATENYTDGEFNIACNRTYDFYIPPKYTMIQKDLQNSNWVNYMLFGLNGVILLVLFAILLLIGIRGVLRK